VERGTHFWPEYFQVTDAEHRATLMIPDGALAFECKVKDHMQVTSWTLAVNAVKDAGYTPDEIRAEVGHMPFTYGLGVLTPQEIAQLDRQPGGNKMTHVERCQKRAYMMALKQLFDLPLGGSIGSSGETIEDYIPEAQWRLVEGQDGDEGEVEKAPESQASDGESLFDDPEPKPVSAKREWSDEFLKELRATEFFPANAPSNRIQNTMNLSPFSEGDLFEWVKQWLGYYKLAREKAEPKPAAKVATQSWAMSHEKDANAHVRFGADTMKAWLA
jgi:hypothetical protein